MKSYSKDKELLSAYIDGELSPSEKKYIEEKIKSSLELQKDLSELKRLKELTNASVERISDSPFFETRLFANLNSEKPSKFNLKKWMPISALTLLTLTLMAILKFNPDLIDNIVKQQKSNLAGFYKENLQPLLYAADLKNEDIFNFALYHELPLDNTNNQILKIGYDAKGSEYFEIKKVAELSNVNKAENLKQFIAALDLNKNEVDKIDSIIGSYSERISALVLVNDKNAVAINPDIWNTRKLILADILAFAEKHASNSFYKLIPEEVSKIDDNTIAQWVSESKTSKDDQYIFCTPDSIFKEFFVFDMNEFKVNMQKMTNELVKLEDEKNVLREYHFKVDQLNKKNKKNSDWTEQFKVFVDTNIIKVSVQNFAVNIPKIDLPNFDSIAIVIQEATQNIRSVRPPSPPVTVGSKNYNYDYRKVSPKNKRKTEVNLDSLMHIQNLQIDKSDSDVTNNKNVNPYFKDSVIILQNNELKKEMDNLRQELQKFRNDLTKPNESDSGRSKKSKQKMNPVDTNEIEI